MTMKLTREKQLLTIWGKAKGKERDALLWGDEVWTFTRGNAVIDIGVDCPRRLNI